MSSKCQITGTRVNLNEGGAPPWGLTWIKTWIDEVERGVHLWVRCEASEGAPFMRGAHKSI
jgi:hypothetical protein